MKTLQKLFLLIMISISLNSFTQTIGDYIDVVYLKNGSVIKGIIIEQTPGKSIKIKTKDGSEYAYLVTEIEKFTREEKSVETNIIDTNKIKWINNFKKKDKGYFTEIDVLVNSGGNGLRFTNGFKFNKLKQLGIALGLENQNRRAYLHSSNYLERVNQQVPVASVNLVYSQDILNYRITPYYQIEAGYGLALERIIHFNDGLGNLTFRNFGGPMVAFATGVKFKTKRKVIYKLGLDYKIGSMFSNNQFHYKENINGPIYIGTEDGFDMNFSLGVRFGVGF